MFIGILGFIIAGSSVAYFKSDVKEDNLATFSAGIVKIEVPKGRDLSPSSDRFVASRDLEWTITNHGTEDVKIMARIVESGQDKDEDIDISSRDHRWKKDDSGNYYYSEQVKPQATIVFPVEVLFNTWNAIEDYGINIEAEAIQASNDAIDYKWQTY